VVGSCWAVASADVASVGRGLVWERGRHRSCAAVSPGEILIEHIRRSPRCSCGDAACCRLFCRRPSTEQRQPLPTHRCSSPPPCRFPTRRGPASGSPTSSPGRSRCQAAATRAGRPLRAMRRVATHSTFRFCLATRSARSRRPARPPSAVRRAQLHRQASWSCHAAAS
jgi:hypothetical protein